MEQSRRQLFLSLPALLVAAVPGFSSSAEALPARAYPFADLRGHRHGGSESWPVLDGLTHSGFRIELHETQLAPAARPHPPHRHAHEEIFLVREGTVQVTLAGQNTRLGPGGVAYVASNVEHGILNVGDSNASYFVIALGTDRPGRQVRATRGGGAVQERAEHLQDSRYREVPSAYSEMAVDREREAEAGKWRESISSEATDQG